MPLTHFYTVLYKESWNEYGKLISTPDTFYCENCYQTFRMKRCVVRKRK